MSTTAGSPAAEPANPLHRPLHSIASQPAVQVGEHARLRDAARLMATHRVSCVAVTGGEGQVLGMVTEVRLLAVLRGSLAGDTPALAAAEPMLCVDGNLRCDHGWQLCMQRSTSHLAVLGADRRLVGVVSESDFRRLNQLTLLAGRHLVPAVMQPVARLLQADHTLQEAAALMGQGDDAAAVVVDATGTPVGVLTARDTARSLAVHADPSGLRVGAVMGRPVLHIGTGATLNEAADRMLHHQVRHLVVLDDSGRLVGLLSGHDLARTMAAGLADDAIAEDRARHRAILDALPDLVWLKDPDGVYLACNPRFEQLYATPESGIVGKTDRDFVSAELADFFRQHDRAAMARNAPTSNEELLRFASDGHTELIHTIKTPVRDAKGRLLGVLGIGRDITALRHAEDQYRLLFQRNPAPMVVYTRDDLRLVAANDAFCALYGCTPEEALQMVVPDLLVPAARPAALAMAGQLSGLVATEWQHQRRDGGVMQVLVQSHDIERNGRPCRVVVITDITRQHRARQREQSRLRLLDSLIRGDALPQLLEQLVLDHESAFPGSLCSMLLLDEAGLHLRHGAAPSLPDFYNTAIDGIAIGPGVGCCGTAAYTGQLVVCEDLATDPAWVPFRALAQQAGLGACWSTPVLGAGGQVLGTFAVYRRQPALPADEEVEHAAFAAGLAALAIGQHRNAQRLRNSERRLADTLQAVPDPIWLTDSQGTLLLANAAYRRLVAAAPEHNSPTLARHDAGVLQRGMQGTAEHRLLVGPDRHEALFEVVATPMQDAAGQTTGVLGAARDITAIRRSAQTLADQLRLVDTMFSQTSDAILLIDPVTLQFVTFNEAACQGLGYTMAEFAGLRPGDLQAELDEAAVRDRNTRAMAGETQRFDTLHRHRDGRILQVAITLRRLDYGGRPLLSVVWQDVTDSRRHAASIRRLNQAYAVLSGVNEAIVRLQGGPALLAEVCRIAVQLGGFRRAWIGRRGPAGEQLCTEADSGGAGGPDLPWTAAADAALQGDAPQVLDHAADGGHSVAAFAISPAGQPRSVLVLQADGPGHFDPDQLALYGRLVRDVGHAIESIAAEAARRQEQRLREQLMESVAGLFFVLAPDGRVLMWNRRFEALTGWGSEAVRASHAADYFAPADRPAVQQGLAQALEGNELQLEAPLVMHNGRRVPYLLVARRVDLDTGPVVVGTGIDIADRVAADKELALHRQHLEQLVAQRTHELEQLNRRLGREDLRLRAMLSLSQRAAGLDEAALWQNGIDALVALVGSHCGSLHAVDPDTGQAGAPVWSSGMPDAACAAGAPPLAALCLRALQAGAPVRQPMQVGPQPRLVTAVPVQDRGHAVLVVCVAQALAPDEAQTDTRADDAAHDLALAGADLWDIVQRRRTEIALAQAKAAADAASQAKSAFLANMSHEIRTPLNAVLGFAHLLQREPLSPRQIDHLGKIADASQHLLQVINDILDFSKIEASKVQLDPTDFALRPCLQRMLGMVADKARANQVQLQLSLAPGTPAVVHGDCLRLEQILLNLLSNAVKFTHDGTVDLRVAPLGPGWLRFDVVDTGIGIDDAQLPLLFKPFEQADASTTRRFGGTGLGLAICHRLSLLLGGRIGVTSQPGHGSQFRLDLPLATASAALAAPAADGPGLLLAPAPHRRSPDGPPLQGLRVLLAEDNPINQEVAMELLSAQGAQVDVADDGEAALARAAQGLYDLVLMDVQMPRLDGLRAAAAIRQLPGWAHVPIVAMTASAFPEDRADCLAAGMDDVLVKPVQPDALTQCLLRWSGLAGLDAPPGPTPAMAIADGAPPSTSALRDTLLALRKLLQSHDTEAADQLVREAAPLRAALGGAYEPLATDVQGFAFEAALVRVDALLAASAAH